MHRVLPALAILALAGCATRGSVRELQTDVSALRAEVAALRQVQERAAHDSTRILAELKSLDASLAELRPRLERTATEVERLGSRIQAAEDGIKAVRAELAMRPVPAVVPPPVGVPRPLVSPPPVVSPMPLPSERRVREVSPRPRAAEIAYGAALATFRAREHGQAVLEFLDFLAKYPKHPLAVNAQYWIGEAYYAQRDYRQALAEFQKVLELPARGGDGKAADALLKVGLCYVNLREPGRAQQAWERLIRDHPGSEAAARAKSLVRGSRSVPGQ